MAKSNVVIFADESLYESLLLLGADTSHLEIISESIGPVVAINCVHDNMQAKLPRVIRAEQIPLAWSNRLREENKMYVELRDKFSQGNFSQFEFEIAANVAYLTKTLNLLDKGATSKDDIEIFANAMWFGQSSTLLPWIVTDDSDLLRFGHLIASYCGIPVSMFSVLEIVRLVEMDDILALYCAKNSLPLPNSIDHVGAMFANRLKEDLSTFTRRTLLAFHPTLRRNDNIDTICKKR